MTRLETAIQPCSNIKPQRILNQLGDTPTERPIPQILTLLPSILIKLFNIMQPPICLIIDKRRPPSNFDTRIFSSLLYILRKPPPPPSIHLPLKPFNEGFRLPLMCNNVTNNPLLPTRKNSIPISLNNPSSMHRTTLLNNVLPPTLSSHFRPIFRHFQINRIKQQAFPWLSLHNILISLPSLIPFPLLPFR